MTTLLLQTAGTMIGGAVGGPLGAALGSALGSAAGYAIDQHLFGEDDTTKREGPRLSELQVQTSTEGAPIARLYGRARLNGQIIWATDFVEKIDKRVHKSGGGKGAPKSRVEETTYSYYANFAVGLCEGEIADIGRIWANGKALDLQTCPYRLYKGTEEQLPDSLIEAKQGEGQAPAYRGLAYVVFEELPLEEFGNRIPQLSFEVIRPVGTLETKIKSIVMIPGATEFGYDTTLVSRQDGEGHWISENRHGFEKGSDFEASVDQLLALCPNLKRVALVCSWFGTDLRAGHCAIHPCTDNQQKVTKGGSWSVAGITRAEARTVSTIEGRASYGGTPSDSSVITAIKHLKGCGLKVVLYPFLLMDIPSQNALPNPYGGDSQAAFPWRGRITCYPAPAQPGSLDGTLKAEAQIQHFYEDQTWSYKRMITHYADLAVDAGGVDAFLIGSELRGLTQVRGGGGSYPFVDCLRDLAQVVKTRLGTDCKLTYGADWSEYFGHKPANEPDSFYFNLDPLWADPNIDAIGMDNYMPLSDWRAGESHLDRILSDTGLDRETISLPTLPVVRVLTGIMPMHRPVPCNRAFPSRMVPTTSHGCSVIKI